jgi:hypothetical protein
MLDVRDRGGFWRQGCIKLRFGPRAVSARSGHEGKKAPERPTPKPIVTRCEPGRLAVRELDAALCWRREAKCQLAPDTLDFRLQT